MLSPIAIGTSNTIGDDSDDTDTVCSFDTYRRELRELFILWSFLRQPSARVVKKYTRPPVLALRYFPRGGLMIDLRPEKLKSGA